MDAPFHSSASIPEPSLCASGFVPRERRRAASPLAHTSGDGTVQHTVPLWFQDGENNEEQDFRLIRRPLVAAISLSAGCLNGNITLPAVLATSVILGAATFLAMQTGILGGGAAQHARLPRRG